MAIKEAAAALAIDSTVVAAVKGRTQLNLIGHDTYLDRLSEAGAGVIYLYDEDNNLVARFLAIDESVSFS